MRNGHSYDVLGFCDLIGGCQFWQQRQANAGHATRPLLLDWVWRARLLLWAHGLTRTALERLYSCYMETQNTDISTPLKFTVLRTNELWSGTQTYIHRYIDTYRQRVPYPNYRPILYKMYTQCTLIHDMYAVHFIVCYSINNVAIPRFL